MTIETTCGKIEERDGRCFFHLTNENENLCFVPFTDHWTYDTFIMKHEGKYGIFTLPNMADYGNNGTLEWVSMNKEPFPYDDVRIKGMRANYFGQIAFRIGEKWGIDNFLYDRHDDCIVKIPLVQCNYSSLAEAEKELSQWIDPFSEVG